MSSCLCVCVSICKDHHRHCLFLGCALKVASGSSLSPVPKYTPQDHSSGPQLPKILSHLQLKVPSQQDQLIMLCYSRLTFWKRDNLRMSLKNTKGRNEKTHNLCLLREGITRDIRVTPHWTLLSNPFQTIGID